MEKNEYRKLAENVEVISAVLQKTSCDIAEISNMMICTGVIFLLRQIATVVYVCLPISDAAGYANQLLLFNAVVTGICCLAEIVVFSVFFLRCDKKKNRISIALMKLWGILLFILLPVLNCLYNYIGSLFTVRLQGLLEHMISNQVYFSADITYVGFYLQMFVSCIEALFILLGIYMVGTFAHNRLLKSGAFLLMIFQAVLSLLAVLLPDAKTDFMMASQIFSIFSHTLGFLLCGILLKADKRRILHGIE